jgi:hypothetical protein
MAKVANALEVIMPDPTTPPTTNMPSLVLDRSTNIAVSLQKDNYASYKKGIPSLIGGSPASTVTYQNEISNLNTALFDV